MKILYTKKKKYQCQIVKKCFDFFAKKLKVITIINKYFLINFTKRKQHVDENKNYQKH